MRSKRPPAPRVPEDPSSEKLAYGKALGRLARREMSSAEVRRGLSRDGFTEAATEGAVKRLEEQRYLDDSRMGERIARSRLSDRD